MVSVAKKLIPEVLGWSVLGMIIVIASIVLLNFKGVSGVTAALNTVIDNIISGISEPQNWVTIVIISLIGISIIVFFIVKARGMKT